MPYGDIDGFTYYYEELYHKKRPSNYASFKENILFDFEKMDIETKEELLTLMNQHSYRLKFPEHVKTKGTCTPKQVNLAWGWLKDKAIQKIIDDYIVHTYHKQIIFRAKQDVTIKGKSYRKGQFIPKKRD